MKPDDAFPPLQSSDPEVNLGELLLGIEDQISQNMALAEKIRSFVPGELLLAENAREGWMGLILEGKARLLKQSESGDNLEIDTIGRGEMIGLLSYLARDVSFIGVKTLTEGRLFRLSWEEYSQLPEHFPKLAPLLAKLMRLNLMGRYRRLVRMHLEKDQLARQLDRERLVLKETIQDLEQTRTRLIQQERMALLGKMMAGLAHELNNPVAAIQRHTDYLARILQAILGTGNDPEMEKRWQAGLQVPLPDSRTTRERSTSLRHKWPHLGEALVRRMAMVPKELLEEAELSGGDAAEWEAWLLPFEAGRFVQTLQTASSRISRLVRGLGAYARPSRDGPKPVDLEANLREALLLLTHELREIDLHVDFSTAPVVVADPSELQQVWTNLILNACEAMQGQGSLTIRATSEPGTRRVGIRIEDTGPGVSPEHLDSLFEPHFTTKSRGGGFGLGLGLSIARGLVEKYGGEISIANRPSGGAGVTVCFPAAQSTTAQS